MQIAIIGYGKMGRIIEENALKRGHRIGSIIDIDNQEDMLNEDFPRNDVAIEFTVPATAFANVSKCFDAGLPVVSGTTGWMKELELAISRCKKENCSFLHATNFSLGVNILFQLNKFLAGIMEKQAQYDPGMTEIHHTQKLDAPSGTAITLANDLCNAISRKNNWTLSRDPRPEEISIHAIREGNVPGVHEVIYESEFDSLSIKHSAKSREGLALGAIIAAEYLHDRKGFYTMDDVLKF